MNHFLKTAAEYYSSAGAEVPMLHAASAEEVFGPLSQLTGRLPADGVAAHMPADGFTSTSLFHAVAVALLICYIVVLYRNPELLKSLRDYIFSPSPARDQHLSDNRTNDPLRGFSWGQVLLDMLFVCTAALRIADIAAPDAAASIPPAARMTAIPAVAGIFCLMAACQRGMLALTGSVTVSQPLTAMLNRVRSIYFRLTTVVLTPLLLLCALDAGSGSRTFEIAILLGGLFIAVAFLRETFLLFIAKKLSIYHWILYLCTVEVFPVSLICLLAVRS